MHRYLKTNNQSIFGLTIGTAVFFLAFLAIQVTLKSIPDNNSSRAKILSDTCQEPSAGCGPDHYWDSSTCNCISSTSGSGGNSGGGSCQEPSSGCGQNYYWNSSTCNCVYISPIPTTTAYPSPTQTQTQPSPTMQQSSYTPYPTECREPSTGCGSNYFWSQSSCQCVHTGTSGNSSSSPTPSISPTPTSFSAYGGIACIEPTQGCGATKIWDTGRCECRSTSSGTSTPTVTIPVRSAIPMTPSTAMRCAPPSSGCGNKTYWNEAKCTCAIDENSTHEYPSWYLTDTSITVSTDRLLYESTQTKECIKDKLSEEEYEMYRYKKPVSETDRISFKNLENTITSCWTNAQSSALSTSDKDERKTQKPPSEKEQCLLNVLDQQAYTAIQSGIRNPTFQERSLFEQCYGKIEPEETEYLTDNDSISAATTSCLKEALGDTYESTIQGTAHVSPLLQKQVDACFGITPKPFSQEKRYTVSATVRTCLIEGLGEDTFESIRTGQNQPSVQETEIAKHCFEQINDTQEKLLPPPVEMVPFIDEEPHEIAIDYRSDSSEESTTNIFSQNEPIVLRGSGPPNSLVTIYLYSEPIVVTTTTDENGEWIYELTKPLSGEKHIAYATVKTETGRVVRSSVFDFTVVAAEEIGPQQFVDVSTVSDDVQTKFIRTAGALVAGVIAIILGGAGIVYILLKSRNKKDDGHPDINAHEGKQA